MSTVIPIRFLEADNFIGPDSINEVIEAHNMNELVANRARSYYAVDLSKGIGQLAGMGDIFKLAYAGTLGYDCHTAVFDVMLNCQPLFKSALGDATSFTQTSIQSMERHKRAIRKVNEGDINEGIQHLAKCKEYATKIAEGAAKASDQAKKLSDSAKKALIAVSAERALEGKKRKEIEKIIDEAAADEAVLKQTVEDLTRDMEADLEKEKQAKKDADRAHNRAGAHATAQAIVRIIVPWYNAESAIKNEHKQAEAAQERESGLMKSIVKMQQQLREANKKLAKAVEKLENSPARKDSLVRAIHALDIGLKGIGSVRTVLENTRIFWKGVQKHCESLEEDQSNIEFLSGLKANVQDEVVLQIRDSGLSWLALGKAAYDSLQHFKQVNENFDSLMRDLPTEEESNEIITTGAGPILARIKQATQQGQIEGS